MKTQVAALPVRRTPTGKLRILLVTSRTDGEWMIPKGSRIAGLTASAAAALEALEEGGVKGRMGKRPIGSYVHESTRRGAIRVNVFELLVEEQLATWREGKQRLRKWATPAAAARLTTQPGLRELFLALA